MQTLTPQELLHSRQVCALDKQAEAENAAIACNHRRCRANDLLPLLSGKTLPEMASDCCCFR